MAIDTSPPTEEELLLWEKKKADRSDNQPASEFLESDMVKVSVGTSEWIADKKLASTIGKAQAAFRKVVAEDDQDASNKEADETSTPSAEEEQIALIAKVVRATDTQTTDLIHSMRLYREMVNENLATHQGNINKLGAMILPAWEQWHKEKRDLESERDWYRQLAGAVLRALAGPTIEETPNDQQGMQILVTDRTMRFARDLEVVRERDASTRSYLLAIIGKSPLHEADAKNALYELTIERLVEGNPIPESTKL